MASELIHDAEARRYLLKVDGKLASAADYTENDKQVSFTHTFTDPKLRGHGYAAQVVEFAVNDVEASGRTVVPMCWYVAKWFDEHPERAGLLAH